MTDWYSFERYVAINEARYPADRRYTIKVTGISNGRNEEIRSVEPPNFRTEMSEQEVGRLLDCYWKTREWLEA